jgi:protein gp37
MGENSKIEWTDHTFNPWEGCTKVSEGCKHCYAEALSKRFNRTQWGPTAQRRRTSDSNWRQPLAWNKKAEKEGRRYRVFCASMADVFEWNPQVEEWRFDLFMMIDQTPHLDWLLLTKRPEHIMYVLRSEFNSASFPSNVWLGTSVENQEAADKRIPELLNAPAAVRFLSCEPLLGPLDLSLYLVPRFAADDPRHKPWRNGIDWVIVGGESGPHARPMHPDWVSSIRDQCRSFGVPFLFKQWGGRNKKATGRDLDGRTWDEIPQPARIAA